MALLTLSACNGIFQMLTTTPNCIDAVDFGDIVSQKLTLKVNPNEWDTSSTVSSSALGEDKRCEDASAGYDGYYVDYYDTGVDYTSTNNPLTVKAYGYGDFCSASFNTGYEKADSAECESVDCNANPSSNCCQMAIQEDSGSCAESLILINSSIHGEQPAFDEDELGCSTTGDASSSFYFNNNDEFLVLVPKICIPGATNFDEYNEFAVADDDSCGASSANYKEKQVSGVWENCTGCSDTNLASNASACALCSCAILDYTCPGTVGSDGTCSQALVPTVAYSPNEIDFASDAFNYRDANTFTIDSASAADGVCSNFEYLVMQNYKSFQDLNNTYDDWNYTDEELKEMALDSIQLDFFMDMDDDLTKADYNLNTDAKNAIVATQYRSGDKAVVFLNQGCSPGGSCNFATYTCTATSSTSVSCSSSGTSSNQCDGFDDQYEDIVEDCTIHRYNYNNCMTNECLAYYNNADVTSCTNYCATNYVTLGYTDTDDCFDNERSVIGSACEGLNYRSFNECVETASSCAIYRSGSPGCYSYCDSAATDSNSVLFGHFDQCILADTSFCTVDYNACMAAASNNSEEQACETDKGVCVSAVNGAGCPSLCSISEEQTEWSSIYASCCSNTAREKCVTFTDGSESPYWNDEPEQVYLYYQGSSYNAGDPVVQLRLGGSDGATDNRWVYLHDTDVFTKINSGNCPCLFDSDIDCEDDDVCYNISTSGIDIASFNILHYKGTPVNGWARLEYVKPYVEIDTCDPHGGGIQYKSSRPFDPHWEISANHAWSTDHVDYSWDFGSGYGSGCWDRATYMKVPYMFTEYRWKWKGAGYSFNNYENNKGTGAIMIKTLDTCTGTNELVRIKIGNEPEVDLTTLSAMSSSQSIPSTGRIYARVVDSFEQDEGECFAHTQDEYDYFVANNSGSFLLSITTMEDEIQLTNIVPLIIEPFNYLFAESFQESAFNNLVGQGSWFQTILKTLLTLYIAFLGFIFTAGLTNLTQGDLLARLIRIGVVYLFVSPAGWDFFYTYIIQFFENGSQELAELFTYSLIPELEDDDLGIVSSFAVFDYFFYYLFQEVIVTKLVAILFSPLLIGWLLCILVIGAVLFVMRAIVTVLVYYVYFKVVMAILFLVGPIAFIFLIFESTKAFFTNWLNMILSYSLQLAMLFFVVNIFGFMILAAFFDIFSFGVCWSNILSIDLPAIPGFVDTPPFEVFSFWRAAGVDPRYSTEYNAAQTVSFYSAAYFFALGYFFVRILKTVTNLADSISGGGAEGVTLGSLAAPITKNITPAAQFLAKKAGKYGFRAAAFGGKMAYKTAAPIARNAINTGISAAKTVGYSGQAAFQATRYGVYKATGAKRMAGGVAMKYNESSSKARKQAKATFKNTGKTIGSAISGVTTKLPGNLAKSAIESKGSRLRREFGEMTGLVSDKEAVRRREQGIRFKKEVKAAKDDIKAMNVSDAEKLRLLRTRLNNRFRGEEAKVNEYLASNQKKLLSDMSMKTTSRSMTDRIMGRKHDNSQDPFEIYKKEVEKARLELEKQQLEEEELEKRLNEEKERLRQEISDRIRIQGIDASDDMTREQNELYKDARKHGAGLEAGVNRREYENKMYGKTLEERDQHADTEYFAMMKFRDQKLREQADLNRARKALNETMTENQKKLDDFKKAGKIEKVEEMQTWIDENKQSIKMIDDRLKSEDFTFVARNAGAKQQGTGNYSGMPSKNIVQADIFDQKVAHEEFMSNFKDVSREIVESKPTSVFEGDDLRSGITRTPSAPSASDLDDDEKAREEANKSARQRDLMGRINELESRLQQIEMELNAYRNSPDYASHGADIRRLESQARALQSRIANLKGGM